MTADGAVPPDKAWLSPPCCCGVAASTEAEPPAAATNAATPAAVSAVIGVDVGIPPETSRGGPQPQRCLCFSSTPSGNEIVICSAASTATEETSVAVAVPCPAGRGPSFYGMGGDPEQPLGLSSNSSSSNCSINCSTSCNSNFTSSCTNSCTSSCTSSCGSNCGSSCSTHCSTSSSTSCSLTAVLKRQALLAAIGRIHSTGNPNSQLKTTASAVLHFVALLLSFVMLVTLWGVLDVAVEVLAGPQTLEQLQGYGLMLFVGLLLTFLLKFVERQGHKLTIYPTLIVSLVTVVAAWGIIVSFPMGLLSLIRTESLSWWQGVANTARG
ncbi:hypothetical protein, conserved [Eimeria maxima]|uniref:Uncharacterized protein n=1 Tax=Eimeria maxima TaxID=5804 RepID=U6MAE4_EIMMA|nr:hypothetical protein, conserved [Eimeria maxima]CDJ58610.1 hypothetical protein, conserved [Eimeria maxima]